MNPLTWLDERGQPRPKCHCPRCGPEIAVLSTPSEYLKSWAGQSLPGLGRRRERARGDVSSTTNVRNPTPPATVNLNNPRVVSPN